MTTQGTTEKHNGFIEPNETIDERYRILEVLGGGGSATIYKAIDTVSGDLVALKFLSAEGAVDSAARERFGREGHLLCTLSHPNLVHGFCCGVWQGCTFIVMEFIDGPALNTLVAKQGALGLRDALTITLHIAAGLSHLHLDGRVFAHRDLKPGNIMIASNGTAKLIDFGIAKTPMRLDRTLHTRFLGSLCYISPEQIEDSSRIDIRTDIYALGAVFFELLTGRKAFLGVNNRETLEAHFAKEIPHLPSATLKTMNRKEGELCNQILERTLDVDLTKRFQTPIELVRFITESFSIDIDTSVQDTLMRSIKAHRNKHAKKTMVGILVAATAETIMLGVVIIALLTFGGDRAQESDVGSIAIRSETGESNAVPRLASTGLEGVTEELEVSLLTTANPSAETPPLGDEIASGSGHAHSVETAQGGSVSTEHARKTILNER